MNVRQWLGRARYIDREIQSLEKALQDARDQATRITQNYEADGAQSTKDPHKLDKLAEYADLIREKQAEIITVKNEIFGAIYNVTDSRYRIVLVEYYINKLSLEEIAVKEHYSYRHVRRFLRAGADEVNEILSHNVPIGL